jgi:GTPase Era involved in 16S rRNA processing
MGMLLVHELHEARDRLLLLKQRLLEARRRELPAYLPFLDEQIGLLDEALYQANIPDHYRVAVVGRFKVGKSAFVNKLAGERLAGVDTNPETAAISIFRYDSQARAEVEFIKKEEWDHLAEDHADDPKNPEVKRYDRFITFNERPPRKNKEGKEIPRQEIDLKGLVERWVKPGGLLYAVPSDQWETKAGKKAFLSEIRKFTSSQEPLHYLVNKLTIYAPIPILRDQIELIDTPGLDDTEHFRVLLTEDLVKEVDAILFLTASGASYSQSDKEFIVRQLRRRQIKHLQFIVTKCDETYDNAVRDARENDDPPPLFSDFYLRETNRIRAEVKATLNELLQTNQLTDEEGYYFIEQLDEVPIHLISTKYHDDGEREKAGIETVRDRLYGILSKSQRFEQSRKVLHDRLDLVLTRLRGAFWERRSTLEKEFDPARVREEISSIKSSLSSELDSFGQRLGESLGLLGGDQEAFFQMLPTHLDVITLQAREVLSDLEKADLIKHWKTRRSGYWGYLTDLQAKIADRVFPKVEAVLNTLRNHLDIFMESAGAQMTLLQGEMVRMEQEHYLTGLEPIALSASQAPMLENLQTTFQSLAQSERDGIVTNLDQFVSQEVQERLDNARQSVSDVWGRGTTLRQAGEVSGFYSQVRDLLSQALRNHLEKRVQEFAGAIKKSAESVGPRIRESSEGAIRQRLAAVESALQVEREGKKGEVSAYLSEMVAQIANFAAEPAAVAEDVSSNATAFYEPVTTLATGHPVPPEPCEQHYEIKENATGYTYERIFRPYIDSAEEIVIEDPYIRLPHQVDNLARFCALAVRLGAVKKIELVTGSPREDETDESEGRLEALRRDLHARGIYFSWTNNSALHDREVRFSNGWVVKIGRGLDIYQKPESWVSVEAADFTMRRCRQTKIDAFRVTIS